MFEHTLDEDWQNRRQAAWDREDLDELKSECTRTQMKALAQYYQTGNAPDLIRAFANKKQVLLLSEITKFGPFADCSEFHHNIECYCANYAAEKLTQNIMFYDMPALERTFCRSLFNLNFDLHNPFTGAPFASSLVAEVFGDQFKSEISYPTEFSVLGSVKCSINADLMFHYFNRVFRHHLARKSAHQSHAVYRSRLPYYLSLFPHLETAPLSTAKLDNDDFDNILMEARPTATQFSFRMLLANLYGYQHDCDADEPKNFGFANQEFRDELRQGLELLNLGQNYDDLVGLVHKHKGKIYKVYV